MSSEQVYVVAVSGGVDSVALLHMLVNQFLKNYQLPTSNSKLIMAHFDHGIREESGDDAQFVADLATKYGLSFELGRANLGPDASEETARDARYNFLRQCCIKYNATCVITAHHQDDLVETALINLIRGTSWRGLASLEFSSSAFGLNIIRPLLNISKKEILRYAEAHELQWVEDSSNQNLEYLRNYVRRTLIPSAQVKDPLFTEKLTALITNTQSLKATINQELQTIVAQCTLQQDPSSNELPRYSLIMWPDEVSREVIYLLLTQLDPTWHPSKLQIIRALHFIKSGLPGKEIQISGKLTIVLKTRTVQFKTV